ncbi:MAG TPA: pilus assembly protein PilM, partial [Chthoniobacterales bacterium]|nr:pilus assembly protein PilM [Chthoniobacterales bacterium]
MAPPMPKRGNSVIGLDLGKHVFKGVVLHRKGDARYVLTSYASREVPEDIESADDLAQELKALLKELGSAKGCAVAVSDPSSLLRIIEQPDTPVDLLRNALRLNGLAVLNQECKDFVLDCAAVSTSGTNGSNGHSNGSSNGDGGYSVPKKKYLVGGMLRPQVKQITDAMTKTRLSADILQLAPVCSFNAFELAYPQIFENDTFLLLDMGHLQSTVLIGSKKELVLVRSIEYGGKSLTQALTADGALDANAAKLMMEEGDGGMTEICRTSLTRLATEVRNSIGFFEGQREESIHRIFVSGSLARTETILQTLSDELGLPCEIWDPLETCEVALPAAKRQALPNEFVSLNVACGAAFEY